VNSLPKVELMKWVAETNVLSSLRDLTKHKDINGPISLSAAIRSAKSGIGEFSGSFLSFHCFHYYSFLWMESGKSLKNAIWSPLKWCLDRAMMLSHYFSSKNWNGFYLSALASNAAPLLRNSETSAPLIFLSVYLTLKHIIRINEILSFSKSPLFTYLYT